MERRRPNYYDDMDPHGGGGENGSFHRLLRILLTLLMAVLIIASAGGLYWMMQSDTETQKPQTVPAEKPAGEEETLRVVRETLGDSPPVIEEEQPEPAESGPPVVQPLPEDPPEPVRNASVRYRTHRAAEGEQLGEIARLYGLDPRTLVSVNRITSPDDISVGRELRIPDRDGQLYTIRAGDSLSRIAHSFGMGYLTLAEINGINPNAVIHPGDTLFVPRITMGSTEYRRIMQTLVTVPVSARVITRFRDKRSPVTGEILAEYPGIEFSVPKGTPIAAAIEGRVNEIVTLSNGQGIGRYVVLSHDDGYQTVYGHLENILVQEGQLVRQGQVIAESGDSGLTLAPVLYFSISRNGIPLDPEGFF